MSRNLDVTPEGGATGFACEPAADLFVGRIESVVGSCTLARPGELPAELKAGDRIRQDDVIETSAGGRVGIRFLDGSVFNLSDRARMAVKEFIADGASPNALFDISNGTFAFIAGQMAKAGRLGIETPFGKIRGRSGAGGIGMLSLVSLFFAALEEVQAFESGYSYLDDGQINYQDSQEFKDAPVGTVELIIPATGNQPEQHIMLGDASQSIVIRSLTNSTVVSYVQNSLTDMLRNDKAATDAIHLYSLGQSGPAGFGNGGSSGLPPEFQPFIQENNVIPPPPGGGASGGGPLGSPGQQSNAPEVLPVIKPPPPPEAVPDLNSIIANPDSNAAGNVLTNDAVTGPGTTGVGSLTVINIQDADENQPVAAGSTSTTNSTVIHGLYGTLRVGADGSYNYEVNADNPTVKALGQGQSIQDNPFTYTVTDGTTTAQTTLTITVTGVNDAPVASADTNWAKEVTSGAIGNVLQTLAHNGAPSGSFSDNADTDVDNGTTLTVTNIQDANENLAITAGTTSANGTVIHGLYGTLTIGANGSYSYVVDNSNPTVQALAEGQTLVDNAFTYTVTDGTTTTTAPLTITVFGTNDAPVASADTNWAKEDTSGAIGNVLQTLAHNGAPSGSFSDNADTDVDNGTTLTVTNIQDANENLAITAGTTSANGTVIHGLYGTLTIGANGSYSYVVDNSNPTVQALAEGQTLVDNAFTYTVTDGTTTTTAPLTITVFGTNDAPVASADTNWAKEVTSGAIGNVLQTLAHNGAPSGSFSDNADTDVDNGTTLTVTNIQDANENLAVTAGTTSANGTVIHGLYGTLTIGANGSYSYVVDNSNPTVQALAEGQTLVDNAFTYTVTDGTTTTTAPLTITVFGTNDAPVASADTNWAKEVTSGAIGNVLQTLAHNGAPSGSFSDNADTDVDNGTTLTVTNIQDANENLAITAGTTSANGTVIHGLYGTLTIGANGSYSYVVDNSNPTVQALAEGQTLVDNAFTYTVTDGTTTTTAPLTITVFGTNDAPVASADTNWAKEDTSGAIGNVLQTLAHNGAPSGSFSDNADTDVDNGTTLTVTNIQDANENLAITAGTTSANGTVIHGLYGTLTIGANGSYSYVVDNSNPTVQALAEGQTLVDNAFTYTVTDGITTTTAPLTITVFGTNDAPVASADTNWAKEDTSGAIGNVLQTLAHNGAPSGSFSDNADTDVDNGTTLTVTNIQDANENLAITAGTTSANGTVIHGLYGTLTIGANGSYSYVVDNSNPTVQALAEGQTLVDNAFTYTVTDGTTTTTAPLTITVFGTNDAPVASADTNWAKEDTSGAIGNVLQTLAHNGAPSGSFSDNADTDVDNGTTLTVTNIQDANENLAVTAGTTSANGTVIHGLYGTLTIGANGSYSYTPKDDIDNAAGVQDVFTYTVTDGSAPVTSTLTITVFDGAGPTHGNAITLNVDEAALSTAGATGSNPSSTAEIDSSALSFTAGSDSLTSFGFSSDLTGLVKDLNLDGTDDIFSGFVSLIRRSKVI